MTQMDFYRLFVRDLVVPCNIGIHRHERDAPQRVRVTVDIDIAPLFNTESDSIGAVVSYDDVVAAVKQIISLGHINLVETLADRIATNCLEDTRVVKVKVVVEKLDVLGGEATVGAEVIRVNDR